MRIMSVYIVIMTIKGVKKTEFNSDKSKHFLRIELGKANPQDCYNIYICEVWQSLYLFNFVTINNILHHSFIFNMLHAHEKCLFDYYYYYYLLLVYYRIIAV